MLKLNDKNRPERLAAWPAAMQWLAIVAISAAVGGVLQIAGIPAALFLGPLAGGIVAGVNNATVRVPIWPYRAAQGIVGILIARALTTQILVTFWADWPLFVSVVLSVLAASSLLGFLISRWQILPGTAGVWGASPGGATAMVLMAEAFGADARLVAFMQYVRVIFVAVTAAVVAHLSVDMSGAALPETVWFPPIDPSGFAQTIAVVALGVALGTVLRVPAGPLLLPLFIGTVLHLCGYATFQLPEWLLVIGYALIGWSIGLGFTRPLIVHVARPAAGGGLDRGADPVLLLPGLPA